MKYIIIIWMILIIFFIGLHIGKYINFKELQKKIINKNNEQILDYIYNHFKL